jgi:hypothetical protein
LPVLILAYNREIHIPKCLSRLLASMRASIGHGAEPLPQVRIFISQDGDGFPQVTRIIERLQREVYHALAARGTGGAAAVDATGRRGSGPPRPSSAAAAPHHLHAVSADTPSQRRPAHLSGAHGALVQRVIDALQPNDQVLPRHGDAEDGAAPEATLLDWAALELETNGAVYDVLAPGGLVHLIHNRDDSGATAAEAANGWQPYYAISHHYAWAVQSVLAAGPYRRLIILEEDIEVAGDFLSYMAAHAPLFALDPSLLCVSAWNDNGKWQLAGDVAKVYRSDFFPGMGWMAPRSLFEELRPKWPLGFWDDWLRQPRHRKGRHCLRPEVPRTRTWCDGPDGAQGTSGGQFCAEHMRDLRLPAPGTLVDWGARYTEDPSLRHGLLPAAYDAVFSAGVAAAPTVDDIMALDRSQGEQAPGAEVKVHYGSNAAFENLAHFFGIMEDFKDGVPRTAYKGVVSFRWPGSAAAGAPAPPAGKPHRTDSRLVHLVPVRPLYHYDYVVGRDDGPPAPPPE